MKCTLQKFFDFKMLYTIRITQHFGCCNHIDVNLVEISYLNSISISIFLFIFFSYCSFIISFTRYQTNIYIFSYKKYFCISYNFIIDFFAIAKKSLMNIC